MARDIRLDIAKKLARLAQLGELLAGEPQVRVGIAGFLTLLAIPLTYSIANGLAIGVIAFDALKILKGEGREAGWLVHALAVLFVLRFADLSAG